MALGDLIRPVAVNDGGSSNSNSSSIWSGLNSNGGGGSSNNASGGGRIGNIGNSLIGSKVNTSENSNNTSGNSYTGYSGISGALGSLVSSDNSSYDSGNSIKSGLQSSGSYNTNENSGMNSGGSGYYDSNNSGNYSSSESGGSIKSGINSTTQQSTAPLQQSQIESVIKPTSNLQMTPEQNVQQQTNTLQQSLLNQSAAEDNSPLKQRTAVPGLDRIFDENAIQRDIRQTIDEVNEQNANARNVGNIGAEQALTDWAWRNTNQPSLADRIMNLGVSPAEAASDIPVDYGSVVRQERLNPSISEFDEQQARLQALQQLPPLSNTDAMRFGVQNTIANSERPNLAIDDAINFMRNDLGISGVNDFGIAGLEPEAERAYALQLLEDGVVPESPQPDFWNNLIDNVSKSLGSFGNTEQQKAITESAQTTAENRGSNGNYPVHEKSDLEQRIIEGLYNKTYPNIIAAAKNTWYDWQNFGKETDAYNQYKENYLNSIGKSEVELTNAERKQLDIDANAYAEQQYPSNHTTPRQEQKNLAAIIEQRERQQEFNSLPEAEVTILNNQNSGNNQSQNNSSGLNNQVDQNGSTTPPLSNLIEDVKSGKYGYKLHTDDGGYIAMPPNPQEILANFGGKTEGSYYDFRAPDSGLVINDDFSDIIAKDRFSSAQNMAIPGHELGGKIKGASVDDLSLNEIVSSYPQNVETVEMTEKEFNAKFDKFLSANPELQSLIDSGAVTRADVAAYFCKNIKVVKEDETNIKTYGGGGYLRGGGGGGRGRGGGGGGGGGGRSYGSSTGTSSVSSGSYASKQSASRIHNIMKNWTF